MNVKKIILLIKWALLLLPVNLLAGSLNFAPVRLDLSTNNPIASITVTNNNDTPTTLQLEVNEWQQDKGQDIYKPSKDVLALPPLAKLAPHGKQIFRIALRRAPANNQELAYRVFIQQTNSPQKVNGSGIRFLVRFGIPIFVKPALNPQLQFKTQLKSLGNDDYRVYVNNVGNLHLKLDKIRIENKDKKVIATIDSGSYLLPGQTASWITKLKKINSPLQSQDATVLVVTDTATYNSDGSQVS